jgi:hypothetical protein
MGIFEGNFEPTVSGVNPLPKPKVCQDAAKRATVKENLTVQRERTCQTCGNWKPKQEPSEKSVRKTLRLIGQMCCKHDWIGEPGDYSCSYQQTHCTKCDMVMPLWLEDYVYEHRWAWKLIGGIR